MTTSTGKSVLCILRRKPGRGLARRGIQVQVSRGVLVRTGRFFIHAKPWVVARSTARAGNSLAKDYERKTTHANAWLYVATIRRMASLEPATNLQQLHFVAFACLMLARHAASS